MTISSRRKNGGIGASKRQRLPSVSEDESSSEDSDTSSSEEEETLNGSGESNSETLVVLSDDSDSDEEKTLAEFIRSSRRRLRRFSSPKSVTLPISDVLDCPTCCEPLYKPIFQCHRGHLACLSCCTKLKKRCSICSLTIGNIRCRALENVIKTSSVLCRNANYGCKQSLTYGFESTHEKLCVFAPCSCPIQNCNYTGSYNDFKDHFRARHKRDEDYFIPFVFDRPVIFDLDRSEKMMTIFQEEKKGDLIVVQGFCGSEGVYVTVSLIAPMAPEVRNLSCSLAKIKKYGTVRMGLLVKKIQKVTEPELPEDGFMLIPSCMLSGDYLKMQICIGDEFKYSRI